MTRGTWLRRAQVACALLTCALLGAACQSGQSESGDPSTNEQETQTEGSGGANSQANSPEATADTPPAPTGQAVAPEATGAEPAAEPGPTGPRVELQELMTQLGYADSEDVDIREFVYVPAGADAQAGRFGAEGREVRVAVVHYPNERYAIPHETDIAERARVLPTANEAALRNGSTVIHVRAIDAAAAQAAAAEIQTALGW